MPSGSPRWHRHPAKGGFKLAIGVPTSHLLSLRSTSATAYRGKNIHFQATDNNNHVDVSSAAKPDGSYIGKRWRAVPGIETSRTVHQTDVCSRSLLPSRRTQYSDRYCFPSFVHPRAWWESQTERAQIDRMESPRERTNGWAAEVRTAHHRSPAPRLKRGDAVDAPYGATTVVFHPTWINEAAAVSMRDDAIDALGPIRCC